MSELRERVTRAWSRHPLVVMARYRQRRTFYVGLHSMLRAGVPLSTAFTELSRGTDKDAFRRAVAQVGAAIVQGAGLAEAMRRQPAFFEPQVVTAMEAGEASGTLEHALAGIIARTEQLQKLRWRTFSMCLYPAYLVLAFIGGGALLDAASSISRSGELGTLAGSAAGSFITRMLQVTALGLAVFAAPLALAALGLEQRWERIRLRIPLLGRFHRRLQASRFCEVLGASLGAGLEAARSMEMALEATESMELRARAGSAVQRLRQGSTLAGVVEWLGVLDGESLRQVSIGEHAGRIEPLLHQQAVENSGAALRTLRVLVIAVIVVLAVVLLGTNLARIFEFQVDYFRRIEELSHG